MNHRTYAELRCQRARNKGDIDFPIYKKDLPDTDHARLRSRPHRTSVIEYDLMALEESFECDSFADESIEILDTVSGRLIGNSIEKMEYDAE